MIAYLSDPHFESSMGGSAYTLSQRPLPTHSQTFRGSRPEDCEIWRLIPVAVSSCGGDSGGMDTPKSPQVALHDFSAPFLGKPVWGARQGYGSFLSFEFCAPELVVKEWHSNDRGLRRQAYVQGRWHVWIYCCQWRFAAHGKQIAASEDSRDDIARAMGMLDGQNLTDIGLDPNAGKSRFTFDLGGELDTWPTGDDLTEEQWFIYGPQNVFGYRADGRYSEQPVDTPRDRERWREPI